MNDRGVAPAWQAMRLCVWCLVAVAVEVALYLSYRGHDARFHWFTHFFIGASLALLVMTVVALRTHRPVPLPLLWILLAHTFAMIPDLLFVGGRVHERWMDLFLGHLSSHCVPGRNLTWYLVFLVSLTLYLVTLDYGRARSAA
jgi:hypothetical protein